MIATSVARLQASAINLRELCYHRNRGCILSFEFLWGLGIPFLSASLLLPAFLTTLNVANAWIGFVPGPGRQCEFAWRVTEKADWWHSMRRGANTGLTRHS